MLTDRDLFIATGAAYVRLFEAVQRAVRQPNERVALMDLVGNMDDAVRMWVTDDHEGQTLAQHWHEAKASVTPAPK